MEEWDQHILECLCCLSKCATLLKGSQNLAVAGLFFWHNLRQVCFIYIFIPGLVQCWLWDCGTNCWQLLEWLLLYRVLKPSCYNLPSRPWIVAGFNCFACFYDCILYCIFLLYSTIGLFNWWFKWINQIKKKGLSKLMCWHKSNSLWI